MSGLTLPRLPAPHKELIRYIADHPDMPMVELLKPYRDYEATLRQIYAQDAENSAIKEAEPNLLPLFAGDDPEIQIRARDLAAESEQQRQQYIMPLPDDQRRPEASSAVVKSLKDFQHNFSVFSESSLAELDWSNVVAAGSSVANCLLPVPEQYNASKRTLREFYHEKFCPASDVDLFLYGLTEEEGVEKIRRIETAVRDAILTDTTVVRTKHAVTICSQYPTRHIQIVLRLYQNVSEILTGFDVDCSAAAYDGKQVYCTPRALQSYITQINHIDLSRRSPSYESRLSKYSHRGFEVHWPNLDRSRIDPTIFERSFRRTLGLARLLVLERLPTSNSRDQYLARRREERGRPPLNRGYVRRLGGNIKDAHEDEIAEWVNEDDISNYHSFTIPYGAKFHAKKIEKLCYTRDLLLNAEWNQPKDRKVFLHRHPVFFGRVDDIVTDCCGFCPQPSTDEEKEVHAEESKIYVSGRISFIKDDPGRQSIGSFNPLTAADWTDMAYVGNTARLCQDIVDGDLDHVQDWLSQDGADPNTRDYTGRTPLHLAVMQSTPQVVKMLVDHGARLVARLADGRTALHLAAERGNLDIVRILLDKSVANEAEEENKQAQKQKSKSSQPNTEVMKADSGGESEDSDIDLVDDGQSDDGVQSMASSFVKVKNDEAVSDEDENDPDFYDVNIVAWDTPCSALHFAIVCGHEEVVKLLCQEYGADILLPVKFLGPDKQPMAALLTLVLCAKLPLEKATSMAKTILSLGATCAQADMHGFTAFYRLVEAQAPALIELVGELDKVGAKNAINHVAFNQWNITRWPLQAAVKNGNIRLVLQLLDTGAMPYLDFETWLKAAKQSIIANQLRVGLEANVKRFERDVEQVVILALRCPDPSIALELIKRGVDVNSMTAASRQAVAFGRNYIKGETILDIVRDSLTSLRSYVSPTAASPEIRHGMDEALNKFEEGTFQHTAVRTAANLVKARNQLNLEAFEKEKERIANLKGLRTKQAAIDSAIDVLEQIEHEVLDRGGKTFEELHTDFKYTNHQHVPFRLPKGTLEFKPEFLLYGVSEAVEKRKAKYIELFEAAWMGDLDKIKALTLTSWDPENNEQPLQIAVLMHVDAGAHHIARAVNPFSLAYFRGHHDVAKAILEIAQAQYAPEEMPSTRYRLQTSDDVSNSEGEESDDDDEPQIYSHIIDDRFTVDNIGEVSMQVKSRTKPDTMLAWETCAVVSNDGNTPELTTQEHFLTHAIKNDDRKALKYYFDLTTHFASQDKDNKAGSQAQAFPQWAFLLALERGSTEMLADMIIWAGAGLPLEQLVKKTGVELNKIPTSYPGLTVYGKKRKDWAAKGRETVAQPVDTFTSPLLYAAQKGSMASVEWSLSNAPQQLYLEFEKSEAAKSDVRLKHLNQSPGGFEGAVTRWLGIQNHLAIHAAIMGSNNITASSIVKHLIKAHPTYLEAKNIEGKTPLAVAAELGRLNLVKILIDNGADQSNKDKQGNTIVHHALVCSPKASQLRDFLGLLDPKLRPFLLKERSGLDASDGRSPLHRWAGISARTRSEDELLEELRVLLEFSEDADLLDLDGQGDTALHMLIRNKQSPALIREIVGVNPKILFRENAVGITPAELAHDMFVRWCVEAPPQQHYMHHMHGRGAVDRLLNKTPEQYEQEDVGEALPRVRQIYDVVSELAALYPGERRLVSLNEANDVAERIGSAYQGSRYGWKGSAEQQTRRRLGRRARRAYKRDAEDLRDEEPKEGVETGDFVSNVLPGMRGSAWEEPWVLE